MKRSACACIALVAGMSGPGAWAGDGLGSPDPRIWQRWQGRIALQTSVPLTRPQLFGGEAAGLKVESFALLGDYYFIDAPIGRQAAGGFRATTGLLVGDRSSLWSSSPTGGGLSLAQRRQEVAPGGPADAPDRAVPYVGVGYSGLSARGGWGFAADLGLAWQSERLRLGGSDRQGPGQDDVLRDLRLAPMLQLGVSYSF